MLYRQLGRTGLQVSQLGFGAMRLPMVGEGEHAVVDRDLATPLIHRAVDLGVNYFDTAIFYCNGDSQRAVGEALEGQREQVIISTKNHYYGEDEREWWQNLENSLAYLRTDYLDIYNHHGINWGCYTEQIAPRVSQWMRKAKEQGLVRHICCSFHDGNDALQRVVDTGYVDAITLQYNILDRQLEEGIAYAHAQNIGVVVMGPVGGGRLGAMTPELAAAVPGISRVPELALRYVLANPHVTMALSGMSTLEQLEENVTVASDPTSISEADTALLQEHLAQLTQMADLYCSGCKYCLPCPQAVVIPHIFWVYNMARVYGLWDQARGEYRAIGHWPPGQQADACTACGACEAKCPQRLPIRAQLQEAHRALGASAGE